MTRNRGEQEEREGREGPPRLGGFSSRASRPSCSRFQGGLDPFRLGSASALGFGMGGFPRAARSTMSLWEYKVITSGKGGFASPALLEKFLNDLGRDEWEIVH